MARVIMRYQISGGRGDGTEWPRGGEVLETGDDEAAALIQAGHADPAPAPPKAAAKPAPAASDGSAS